MENGFTEGTPTVTINLDKPRTLAFTLGAMRRAQELGVLSVDVTDGTALMLAMPQYVWACLSNADRKELSVDEIAELMNPNNVQSISAALGELFKVSLPENPEGNASPAAALTTLRSQAEELTAGESNSSSIGSGPLASTPLA